MASALEKQCTMLINADIASTLSGTIGDGSTKGSSSASLDISALRTGLESKVLGDKMDALKRILLLHLNGEKMDSMLMSVIRYVLPHEDAHLRKLGLYFLETVDKKSPDGSMLPEMILVVNMIRNDLVHANEYTRGCALRFCCKLNDAQLLEPLVPSIRQNLEHRHSYVRRNAVLAVHYVFESFEYLLPDATEIIEAFLNGESDLACKRNALGMLMACDESRAVNYLHLNIQQVPLWSETLQLLALELTRQVCRSNPSQKGQYIQMIFSLLSSSSAAVVYQAAMTLIALSAAPTAVRAAAQSFCSLLATQSDNNIKLILLDRLLELKNSHSHVLQELVMDVLRALSSPNMELRRKCLALSLDLVTSRNVDEVVSVLKKELQKSQWAFGDRPDGSESNTGDSAANAKYRMMLMKSLHTMTMKYKSIVSTTVSILGEFLDDMYGSNVLEVVNFMREVCEIFPEMRATVLSLLVTALKSSISSAGVVRGVVWILSEFSSTSSEIHDACAAILGAFGPLPLRVQSVEATENSVDPEPHLDGGVTPKKAAKKPTVLADGTYASQLAEDEVFAASKKKGAEKHTGLSIREQILAGDYFLGVALCASFSKLALTLSESGLAPAEVLNKVKAQAMLTCTSLATFGRSPASPSIIDEGSVSRLVGCIRALSGDLDPQVVLGSSRKAFSELMKAKKQKDLKLAKENARKNQVGVEELVEFDLLRARRIAGGVEDVAGVSGDDTMAALMGTATSSSSKDAPYGAEFRLDRIVQLTGMSDPVYAEAQVVIQSFDVFLDMTLINKSMDTLQNVTLEWATMGDLKLCERPPSITLAPGAQKMLRTNIKVSSTDTGIIFGNIVYDIGSAGGKSGCVILNDIHIDIMDYIRKGEVSDVAFRSMWAEFEWENKVAINTNITDLAEYLDYILASTNMKCLTLRGMEAESGFLAANLYATSVFGEDALVNISAEKSSDGSLAGYVRIRSKTQGIALSLGDKITLKQAQHR
uniref:Coatomer subunit beta n=1 Tax=Timspurckia oligopyrenoides TaxID=708627 RepID=A0A7S0ZID4_9RHOD|mmetsp:Transcript_6507/g.11633  ORF Transcript_6507/g.11633 Transcript_6507/m.11633 type:complete len:991 (+) Transcript_6507:111-3083(+)